MNSLQKQAWLTVIMAVISMVAYLIALPFGGPICSLAMFGIFGLSGLGPLFFGMKKGELDERDMVIARRAGFAGAMISYGIFVLGCMGVWAVHYQIYGVEQVSVHAFPLVVGAGGGAFFLSQAITLLILYHNHVEAGNA